MNSSFLSSLAKNPAIIGTLITIVWISLSVAMIKSAQIAGSSQTAHSASPYVLYLILALTWLQPLTTGILPDRWRFAYVLTYAVLVLITTIYLLFVEPRAGLLLSPVVFVALFGAWFIFNN